MDHLLPSRQTTQTESSNMNCIVDQYLGGGGQGEVYSATIGGKAVALKWYFPESATDDQRAALRVLIEKGRPNEKFLWPIDLVMCSAAPGFGYIMELRAPEYKSIVDLMRRRIDPSFRALATAGYHLSHSYLLLHSKGLCYRDISFGNVFFNPVNGDVLICDNDNVGVDGDQNSGVLGTPRFMAPEVVCRRAMPSTQTDLFSLSVLLFYMLMIAHPLEGRKEAAIHSFDLPAMMKLYGEEALFIYDPADSSNAPEKGVHDNAIMFWGIYPQFLRDLFIKAFTDGIKDPLRRVREAQWRSGMVRLRDSIFYCSECSAENFYDTAALSSDPARKPLCWQCRKPMRLPFRIRLGSMVVMLNRDTELFPHHLDSTRMYNFSRAAVSVTQHPSDPQVWGLKNLSDEKWVTRNPAGVVSEVEPGRSVRLADGVKINFGKTEGEIRI